MSKKLEQKIQAKLDELNKLKEKQRKKDNQQKIILGALVMKECEKNNNFSKQVLDIINSATDRDKNRLQSFVDKLDTTKQEQKTVNTLSDSDFKEQQETRPNIEEPKQAVIEPSKVPAPKEQAPKLDIRTLANQRIRF